MVGTLPWIRSLQSIQPDGKVCIYLDHFDSATPGNADAINFESIKLLCIRANAVLWLTKWRIFQYEKISVGFLRYFRKEFAGNRLVLLDTVLPLSEAGSTFQHMQAGRHKEKTIIIEVPVSFTMLSASVLRLDNQIDDVLPSTTCYFLPCIRRHGNMRE